MNVRKRGYLPDLTPLLEYLDPSLLKQRDKLKSLSGDELKKEMGSIRKKQLAHLSMMRDSLKDSIKVHSIYSKPK